MTNDEAFTLEALKLAASRGHGHLLREMQTAPFTIKSEEALVNIERKKLEQILEALTNAIAVRNGEGGTKLVAPLEENAITDIQQSLAQPDYRAVKTYREGKPVAKVVSTAPDRIWLDLGFDPQDEYEAIFHELHDVTWSQDNASGNGIEYVRADTTPPKRPWVGLKDEEWEPLYDKFAKYQEYGAFVSGWDNFARAIEAKLKEKNQ